MSGVPFDGLEWRLQPRDYLKSAKKGMRLMSASAGGDVAVVESGGYPNSAPAMASGAGGDTLAYLRDNAARASANRTELVLRTGTGNAWNAVETVWDDGTADFMPSLAAMPDGALAVAWMNASRTFADSVTVDEFCESEEIAVGIRNAATGTWTCRNLTADASFDFAPAVRAAANGKVLVAWLRNASGKMTSSAAEPTDIMAAVYANGSWGGATVVKSGVGIVNGFDVAYDGESAVLAYSKDADGDPATVGDAEIYAVRSVCGAWGEPMRLTAAGDADGMPLVRVSGGAFTVLWTAKGALMETRELAVSSAVAVAAADGCTLPARPAMVRGAGGRDALVWNGDSAAGGAADAPTAMMYDPVSGAWGAPVKLFDDGRKESRISGAIGADGGIRICYESSSVAVNDAGEVTLGDVELRTRFFPAACDLAVVEDGFSFSTNEFVNGGEVVLTAKAANLGFRPATNATVRVYEETDDDKVELASVVTNFSSGGVVAVMVPWTVDNTQTNLRFTVEVDAGEDEEDDGAKGNNVYVWNAGTPAVSFGGVSVRNESATRRLLTANVVNKGLGPLPAGAKVVFRRGGEGGEVLADDEIGAVSPVDVHGAGFAWDMSGVSFTSEWETVCVQLYPEGTAGEIADMAFVQVMTTLGTGGDEPSKPTTYVVTYKPGANGTGSRQTATKTEGVALALKGAIFTRTGYTQTGWATSDGGAKAYNLGASYTVNADLTLYPVWTVAAKTYTVQFHKYDGSGATRDQEFKVGETKSLLWLGSQLGWSRDGYEFIGWVPWNPDAKARLCKFTNGEKVKDLAKEGETFHLWAAWKSSSSYRVCFNRNDGSGEKMNQVILRNKEDTLAWLDSQLEWTRPGYNFKGWAESATGAVKYANGAKVKNLAMNGGTKNLYAVWAGKQYKVQYHKYDGSGATLEQTFTMGKAQRLLWMDSQLHWMRAGYEFVGWVPWNPDSKARLCRYANGEEVKDIAVVDGKFTETVHLWCGWKSSSSYRVCFNKNDGSGEKLNQVILRNKEDTLAWLDSQLEWTREGYTFQGWAETATGAVKYANGAKVKNLAMNGGTKNLYAVWKAVKKSVKMSAFFEPVEYVAFEEPGELPGMVVEGETAEGGSFRLVMGEGGAAVLYLFDGEGWSEERCEVAAEGGVIAVEVDGGVAYRVTLAGEVPLLE